MTNLSEDFWLRARPRVRYVRVVGRFRSQWAGLALTGLFALLSSSAHALGVAPAAETVVELRSVDAVVWMDGPGQALVETLVVEPGTARFALLRAFPAPPTEITPVDAALVTDLRAATTAGAPFHARVRERLFGPSIMTPLLAPLLRDAPAPAVPALPTERPALVREDFSLFAGSAHTSTITLNLVLPTELELWLNAAEIVPTRAQRELMARALNTGGTVVAALVERTDPSQALTVGPVLYRFASAQPVLPPALGSGPRAPLLRLYALDDRPLVPGDRGAVWVERPWLAREAPSATIAPLEVTYWGPRDEDVTFRLGALLPAANPPTRVLRGTLAESGPIMTELTLAPAYEPQAIPSTGGRGSGLDLLLAALLGLAPLLYAPESWLLLWAAANARAQRTRGQPPGFAAALWPLYALVVSLFWLVTLSGLGRIAALGPLVIGLYRLFAAGPDRERGPVRVDFKRKLKPKATEDAKAAAKVPAGASKPPPAGLSKPPVAGLSKPPTGASKPPPAGLSKPPVAGLSKPGVSKPPPGKASKAPPPGASKPGVSKPPAKPKS